MKRAGYRIVAAAAGGAEQEGVTFGDFAQGSARRFALAPGVEHIGVLYSEAALRETLAWMNGAFGQDEAGFIDRRSRWLPLLFLGLVVLAEPASRLLPVLAPAPLGAGLDWRKLWPLCALPALLTPILTWMLPTSHFLPMLLADYLVMHFAVYACLTCVGLLWLRARADPSRPPAAIARSSPLPAAAQPIYVFAMGTPIALYVTSVAPTLARLPFLAPSSFAAYCVADAWATRGVAGGYLFSKLCFAVSLGIALRWILAACFS